MPTWSEPPAQVLDGILGEIWTELNEQVKDGPRFEELVGIPLSQLTPHAMQVVTSFINEDSNILGKPNVWIQIYCMGFVIGTKYGERRAQKNEEIT